MCCRSRQPRSLGPRWGAGLVLLALAGCRAESERSSYAGDCTSCQGGPGPVRAGGQAPAPADGGIGDGGVPPGTLVLTGPVGVIASQDLMTALPFNDGQLEISGPGSTLLDTARATYDGSAPYLLQGVRDIEPLYLQVAPGSNQPLMVTVQRVDPVGVGATELFVVDRTVMESLAISASLSAPASLDPLAGHLALFVTDASGDPLPGVTLNTALGSTVAYDAGDTFSDQLLETNERGAILVLDIPATPAGRDEPLAMTDAAGSFAGSVRIVRNAVTLAALRRQ